MRLHSHRPALPTFSRYEPILVTLLPIDVLSMRDDADVNSSRRLIGEIENSIIADAHAPTVAIPELLAARWARIDLERQDRSGHALLR